MSSNFPVSVIVCTKNRAHLLDRLFSSIEKQVYPKDLLEVLIVDNGSTDRTAAVVGHIASASPFTVRYLKVEGSITDARNEGAKNATHSHVVYTDDDCTFEPTWLGELMDTFELDSNIVAVGGQVKLAVREETPAWFGPELSPWLASTEGFDITQPRILAKNERIVEGNMAVERSALLSCGGFLGMERFGAKRMAASEIHPLIRQLWAKGGKIAFSPRAVVYHHVEKREKKWMIQRAYWQGVADVLLEAVLSFKGKGFSVVAASVKDLSAALVLLFMAGARTIGRSEAKAMHDFTRAARRFGLVAARLRLAGDWSAIHAFKAHGRDDVDVICQKES
jgi:glycosyltransferase involved in cell wall biosynthesis